MALYIYPLVFALLVILSTSTSYDMSRITQYFPRPNVEGRNRLLGMILTFNFDHIDPLMLIVGEYQAICEAGWAPTVVIFTTVHWSSVIQRYFRQKSYCYRTNSSVPFIISEHDPSINVALGAQHRKYMQDKVDLYDVFVYHEDDIVFKHAHLVGYLKETQTLHELMPEDGLLHNNIGFQRYRRLPVGGYADTDIFEQELFEETPDFNPVCVDNQNATLSLPYLQATGNLHQAIWIFTREQVLLLQEKCQFLNQSSPSREFMSSFSVWDHCHLRKLLPGNRLLQFTIQHYYQQRHVSWYPTFLGDENIRAGFHYYSIPKVIQNLPPCWEGTQKKNYKQQYGDIPMSSVKL